MEVVGRELPAAAVADVAQRRARELAMMISARAQSARLRPTTWLLVGAITLAGALGALVPGYVDVIGESLPKLAALPALVLLLVFLAWSRVHLLLAIVLVRAATETVFETTRVSIGGSAIGVGGLLNIFAILIAALLIFEKPRDFPSAVAKAWLPFLAVIAFGLAVAPDRGTAARTFLQLSSSAAVACGVAYYVRSPERLIGALKLVVWSSVIPVAFGVWQIATGSVENFPGEGLRLRSTFSHPNPFAFYLTLVITIAFVMIKSEFVKMASWKKFGLALYLVVLIAFLLLTKTRSAWLACAAMFAAYAVLFERRYLVYLIVAGLAALFFPGVSDRIVDLFQGSRDSISSYDKLNSLAWRESLWIAAIDWMTPGHYLTGYGLQAFPFHAPSFFKSDSTINIGAHNVYVQVFFDLGVAGIAAFLWLYGHAVTAVRGLSRIDRVFAFGVVFLILEFLVIAASDNMLDYLAYSWYLWLVIGAGIAAARFQPLDAAAAIASPSPAPLG
jgi:O-antigen ligase